MSNKFNVKLVDLAKVKSERISLKLIKMLQVASIFMENNFGSDFLRFPEEILITINFYYNLSVGFSIRVLSTMY